MVQKSRSLHTSASDLDSLTTDEAFDFYFNPEDPVKDPPELISLALEGERTDLLLRLFTKYPSFYDVFVAMEKLPDSLYLDHLAVQMLETDSEFWPTEEPVRDGSRGAIFKNGIEPFVGVIGKYLPDVKVDEELFSTKARRLKLAENLRAAMAKQNEVPTVALPSVGLPELDATDVDKQVSQGPAIPSSPAAQGSKGNPIPWLIGLATVLVAALVWIFGKKRLS